MRTAIILLGEFGASLFYGDTALAPARMAFEFSHTFGVRFQRSPQTGTGQNLRILSARYLHIQI